MAKLSDQNAALLKNRFPFLATQIGFARTWEINIINAVMDAARQEGRDIERELIAAATVDGNIEPFGV